ncbi:MAG: hypothetical protein H7Y03_04965 [Chitinophagaceae bacterium]|nr:hypothetical protein [Chitinophagaceae bacterium]
MKLSAALLLIAGLFFHYTAISQYNEPVTHKPARFKYYFNGAFGFYLPDNLSKSLANNGSITAANFQMNYHDNYFSRVFFDQLNIKYQANAVVNDVYTSINSKVSNTTFGVDLGYTFPIRRLSPYIYGGAGMSILDVPIVKPDLLNNNVTYATSTKSFLNLRAGIGCDLEISKLFIIYVEGQFSSVPYKTVIDNRRLNGFSVLLGFKTPLQ